MAEKLIFLYLILFPFGQLFRLNFAGITIHPTDLIVGLIAIYTLLTGKKFPKILGKFFSIFALMFFSLALNYKVVTPASFLYFFRFSAYIFLFVFIWKNFRTKKELLLNSLLAVGVIVALFGWIQYLWKPDLTSLQYFDWDDHLYRLVGSYLDPAFTGIILVFTALLALFKKKRKLALALILTVAFTYSRASYLALVAGLLILFPIKKYIKYVPLLLVAVFLLLLLLPRPGGYGVILTRTHSLVAKIANTQQGLQIVKEYPLFGVGFNSLCAVKKDLVMEVGEHSCSGLDNSLLFIIATTGVLGLLLFSDLAVTAIKQVGSSKYSKLFMASLVALFVHTQFTNTLFYPWVMGWIAILWGIVYSE